MGMRVQTGSRAELRAAPTWQHHPAPVLTAAQIGALSSLQRSRLPASPAALSGSE